MDTTEAVSVAWVRSLCATGANAGIRIGAGLTLREVASPLNVSPTTVQRWEQGTAKPTGRRAVDYAALLRSIAPRGGGRAA